MSDKDREQTNLEPEEIEEFSDTDLPADATVEDAMGALMKVARGDSPYDSRCSRGHRLPVSERPLVEPQARVDSLATTGSSILS